ncbi:MAG: FkbM family methyltransferase [Candidatus Acidiferrales bacterium]
MHLQATASRAATLLAKRPVLFGKVLLAKLRTTRRMPPLPVLKRIRGVVFECDLGHYRGTAPMYFGSYALLVTEAMKRYLKPGDTFFDVGANIGYLSAVAAGLVGTNGQVHSFEPVPAYFGRLERLVSMNPAHTIIANSCAAGETDGTCTIYVTREPGQNTMVTSYQSDFEITSTLEVPVVRLDSYIRHHGIARIAMIKIDAEGYEFPTLKGLQTQFEQSKDRPAIICEIAPRAYPLMGKKLSDLAAYMAEYGYTARDLIDGITPVDLGSLEHVEDVLFLAEPGS